MTGRGTTYLAYTFVNIKESVNDYQCLVYNSVYFMNKYDTGYALFEERLHIDWLKLLLIILVVKHFEINREQ